MAKTVVGNLQVRLTAFTKPFEKGMTGARKRLGVFGKTSARIMKKFRGGFVGAGLAIKALSGPLKGLGRIFSGLIGSIIKFTKRLATGLTVAAFAAAAALALLTRTAFKTIDELSKQSDKLGFLTETLVTLRVAAKIAGIENKQLGKGMQKMIKNVAEAATGIGEAVREIDRLGLSAKKLNTLSPTNQLLSILDALEKIDLQSDRVLIGEKIFGGRGLDLIRLTSEGIKDAAKDAERFGLLFSRIDGRRIENANDAVTRLGLLFTGIGQQLALRIAPLIEFAATKFIEWATRGRTVGQVIDGFITKGIELAAQALDFFGLKMIGLITIAGSVTNSISGAFGTLAENVGGFIKEISDRWTELFDLIDKKQQTIAREKFGLTKLIPAAIADNPRASGDVARSFRFMQKNLSPISPLGGFNLGKTLFDLAGDIGGGKRESDALKFFDSFRDRGEAPRFAERIAGVGEKGSKVGEGIQKFGAKTIDFGKLAEELAETLAGNLTDFIGEKSLGDRLKGFLSSAKAFSDKNAAGKFDSAIGDFADAAETFKDAVDAGTGKQGKRGLIALDDATTDTSKLGFDPTSKLLGPKAGAAGGVGQNVATETDKAMLAELKALRELQARQGVGALA